ncbi:MBL fold metallo-hydrolase [Phaeocystidibacter luteus]|uniref:MBL fold metallo-hydrolase n=1 Tax=Phaeocystidibacter luteus TaxID=911197 RepID=A0A6N6RLL0_9FLAO|nr:MBL fold metallo-hydrolase [Phaeocystidibacter luteus]KAB2814458.1 MBL fold metallo-hydrolase [Phaeocystidibacter luteus]
MELILTGTGTSQGVPVIGCKCEVCTSSNPRDRRFRSAAIFRDRASGWAAAIDCGPDFRQQMLGIEQDKLEHILMTHEHMDHVAGIDDVRAYNFTAGVTMNIWATERVQNRLKQQFSYAFHHEPYPGAPRINLRDLPKSEFSLNGIAVIPLPVWHGSWPVHGFRVGDVAYITDVNGIDNETLQKLTGLKFLVLGVLHHEPHHSHYHLDKGIEVAKSIGAEMTYFTHISHRMGLEAEMNANLPDGIQLAHDGLRIPVTL